MTSCPLSPSVRSSSLAAARALVWGMFVSTTLLWHGTFAINSLAHRAGWRRFPTPDDSRNNFWLAILTMGEGWHNNHHHFPSAANQGLYRRELDATFWVLRAAARAGLITHLREIRPAPGRDEAGYAWRTRGAERP